MLMKRLLLPVLLVGLALSLRFTARADLFWGSASPAWGSSSPVLFLLDSAMGTVKKTYHYSDWMWIPDVEWAPGNLLYVVHNTVNDWYNFKLAKVDAATGAVLSDTLLSSLTGTDYPYWNALEYYGGKLYGVENNGWGSSYTAGQKRGHVYEVTLNANGDPVSATLGAIVGSAPDGALAERNGVWYASDWKAHQSSWIKTTTNPNSVNFAAIGATTPVGYFAGWDFEDDGDLIGVSWYDDFSIYKIDLTTGTTTALFNIQSQLPSHITQLHGLTHVVPEPTTLVLYLTGSVAVWRAFRRRKIA